jgi:hypothetical protein
VARVIGVGIALLLGGVLVGVGPAKPDFHGTWTNATQTPLERVTGGGLALTEEEAASHENEDRKDKPGELWRDRGLSVLRIDGVPRSSILIDPPNGRVPPLTDAAKKRHAEITARGRQFGEFDHPEMRPLAERCLLSFGSNAGPPMLPNYFYNNNYTIVQTADHVMILTEMIHDARVIPIGVTTHQPPRIRPWFGDSIGRWEGDSLVVETVNIHPLQLEPLNNWWVYRGGSDNLKVTERFTLSGPDTIRYRFTVDDPATFTAPFTGELLFYRSDERIYEYACHEGNTTVASVLASQRAQEKRDTAQPPPRR